MIEKSLIKLGALSASAEEYLKHYFIKKKEAIWRDFCNCKADLNKLLQIQAQGKQISLLEQEILLNKVLGEEALQALKNQENPETQP